MFRRNVVVQSLFLVFALCFAAQPVFADPPSIPGLESGIVRAQAVNLEVEILQSHSDFVNHIYLVSPGPELFLGTDDDTGLITALPPVTPGTELVFEIQVFDGAVDTGDRWQSGPAGRNSDHAKHVELTALSSDQIQVNFEDLPADAWGVADEPNFVDAVFVVRPLPTVFTPLRVDIATLVPALYQPSFLGKVDEAERLLSGIQLPPNPCAASHVLNALRHENQAVSGTNGYLEQNAAVIDADIAELLDIILPPGPC